MKMKSYVCAVAIIGASTFMFSGCADQSSTNASNRRAASTADPGNRSYSQEDLKKTGRTETGAAVEQVEPSARVRR